MNRFAFGLIGNMMPTVLLAANLTSPGPAISIASASAGEMPVPPGIYCPDRASTFLILEELTVALEGVSRARESLQLLHDTPTAGVLLARANAALALAAGRGSGARVATLIDAALAAKKDGYPKAPVAWFPILRQAMEGLPEDATREAANRLIADAEGILQGQEEGDEVEVLLKAKQMLMCDPLHIPLRRSLDHLERLQRDIARGTQPSDNEFSVLIDGLNRAMSYGLQRLVDLQQT